MCSRARICGRGVSRVSLAACTGLWELGCGGGSQTASGGWGEGSKNRGWKTIDSGAGRKKVRREKNRGRLESRDGERGKKSRFGP